MAKKISVTIIGFSGLIREFIKLIRFKDDLTKSLASFPIKEINSFTIEDIRIEKIIDIDSKKVGKRVGALLFEDKEFLEIEIESGISEENSEILRQYGLREITTISYEELVSAIKSSKPDVIVLSIGSYAEKSAKAYARLALDTGAGLINTSSIPLSQSAELINSFREKQCPFVGDHLRGYIDLRDLVKNLIDMLSIFPLEIKELYEMKFLCQDKSPNYQYLRRIYEEEDLLMNTIYEKPEHKGLGVSIRKGPEDLEFSKVWLNMSDPLQRILEIHLSWRFFNKFLRAIALLDLIRLVAVLKKRGIGGFIDTLAKIYFYSPGGKKYIPLEERLKMLNDFLSNYTQIST